MIQIKLSKVGQTLGVELPQELLKALGAQEGDVFFASVTATGGIALNPYDPAVADQVDAARDVASRYRNALRELAK